MNIKFHKPYNFNDIIEWIKKKLERQINYSIYSAIEAEELSLTTVCYIAEPVFITDDYEERYCNFVLSENLDLLFKNELVQDVVDNAFSQKPSCTNQDILNAIIYYDKYDTFMDF